VGEVKDGDRKLEKQKNDDLPIGPESALAGERR